MNRDRLTQLAGLLEEAFKVTYTNKDGTPGQATFPSEKLAAMYAKTVKNGQVVPVDTEMGDVSVTKAPEATLDDLRASAKTFYKQAQRGEKFDPRRGAKAPSRDPEISAEQQAELEGEFWAASRAAGQSTADAFSDFDYVRRRGFRESSLKAAMGDYLKEETIRTKDGNTYKGERNRIEKALISLGVSAPERAALMGGQIPISPSVAATLVRKGALKKDVASKPQSRAAWDKLISSPSPRPNRKSAEDEWRKAVTEFASQWEEFTLDMPDTPPEDAAWDAAASFFHSYPKEKIQDWMVALQFSKSTMQEVIADYVYDAMTKVKESAEIKKLRKMIREVAEEMVGGRKIRVVPRSSMTGAGVETFGHTDISTLSAPEGATDEEALAYFREWTVGAPLWKFEILRDPDTGKLYAYYEMDTSG